MDNDDDEGFFGVYENGHWEWDDSEEELVFKSDLIPMEEQFTSTPTMITNIDFKDDLDLYEQQRFRKRFQRKTTDSDVVILQDIKDLVLFTAPKYPPLSPSVINILHLSSTERFLRALIFYCQYFIQTAKKMSQRIIELKTQVRTQKSIKVEEELRSNLEDLRILVAKEYCSLIQGSGEFTKFHHMGPHKNIKSKLKIDAIFFESLLRYSVQIVWLALGRSAYSQLELEIHRLFKSDVFNIVKHRSGANIHENMTKIESDVLFGHCVLNTAKLKTFSPLVNEIHCLRPIDYQLLGLGVVNYPKMSSRLRFFERVLIASEEQFKSLRISLGILGLPRSRFDTMLKEIKTAPSNLSSVDSVRQMSKSHHKASRSSRVSSTLKGSGAGSKKLYEDIYLPERDTTAAELLPDDFPVEYYKRKKCNVNQKRKWMNFVTRTANKSKTKRK